MTSLKGSKGGAKTRKKSPRKGHGGMTKLAEKENREGLYETAGKLSEAWLSFDGAKKAAAWYIDNSQKFANQAIDLQQKATEWAKDTPLARIFELQNSIARKFVERSADLARTVWQIQG
ncbi:MAG: hypothetical protein ACREQE_06775 [Candidatus Binataceae bacterium]